MKSVNEMDNDAPQCACPAITAFVVSWNDGLPSDEDRNRLLRPLIPIINNTRSSEEIEKRRATMAADWLVRVHTPAWLRAAKLAEQASALESLPEIVDFAQCPSIMPILNAIRKDAAVSLAVSRAAALAAAKTAAWAAALDTARNAALATAKTAAWAASRAAARNAALAASREAAWAASRDASLDAALDAAQAAIKPTINALQDSAVDLVRRMCEIERN